MLIDGLEETKEVIIKIIICNVIISIDFSILELFFGQNYKIMVLTLITLLGAFAVSIFLVTHCMKEFCVTTKKIITPLFVIMIPSFFLCVVYLFDSQYFIKNPYLLIYFIIIMFIFMIIWWNIQLKNLPNALKSVDSQLGLQYPEMLRSDICRISDIDFLINMDHALKNISEEEINNNLHEALVDWYAVYVSIILCVEGIFMAIWVNIFFINLIKGI